jgi:hypothetical protein
MVGVFVGVGVRVGVAPLVAVNTLVGQGVSVVLIGTVRVTVGENTGDGFSSGVNTVSIGDETGGRITSVGVIVAVCGVWEYIGVVKPTISGDRQPDNILRHIRSGMNNDDRHVHPTLLLPGMKMNCLIIIL